ncbi:phospholipase C/P1 nuclease family protein [Halorussus amylolyticus]|uniref:hypothetical protein n=1 Tax=Halorussus amylolyticus TaxID=1126242 RepID=UPI00104B36C4|nr:hypothetical protein [Halorussus amylolyticus]
MSERFRLESISRRSALKRMSAVGVGLAVGGTGVAAAESEEEIPYDDFERPYPDKTTTRFGPSLRSVTSHPELLAVSKKAVKRHFKSSNLSGKDYGRALQYVLDLRKDYPVEHVSDGDDTVIELAPEAKTEPIYPAKDDAEAQRRHRNAIRVFSGEASDDHAESDADVTPQWDKNHHKDITEVLLDSADASLYEYPIVQASDDPDEFGEEARGEVEGICDQIDAGALDGYKDKACDIVASALDVFHTNYAQYYDPSIASISFGPFGSVDIPAGLGKAPDATNTFYYAASSDDDGKTFGWALHYLQDMAQPLHTGMGIEQAGFEMTWSGPEKNPKRWLHYGFEDLLRDFWDEDPNFSSETKSMEQIMRDSDTAGYVYPKTAAENMAETSTQYASDIYYEILENESERDYGTWDYSTKYNVYKDLANCYSELGYLGRGMIEKFDS